MSETLDLAIGPEVKAVSFDIFDTLVVRSFAKPTDLFLLLESQYVAERGDCFEGFATARCHAEREARERAFAARASREVSLDDIYEVLGRKYSVSPDRELALEIAACTPRPAVVEIFHQCRATGKKTCIVSDMYLPRSVIETILRKCGVDGWDLLLLSHEEGCSKADGGLFEILKQRVRAQWRLKANDVLHLGDRFDSDCLRARQAGLAASHIPAIGDPGSSLWDDGRAMPASPSRDVRLWLSVSRALSNIHSVSARPTFEERIGFEVTGPLAAALAIFVHETARRSNLETIHFLARDGLVVKRVFDVLFEDEILAGVCRSNYLLASRRCLYLASLQRPMTKQDVDHLCHLYQHKPVRRFLLDLGVDVDRTDVSKVVVQHFGDEDRILTEGDQARLRELVHALEDVIANATQPGREAFREHISSQFDRDSLLVDLGWHGTLQVALERLTSSMDLPGRVHGAYLGLAARCPPEVRAAAQAFVYSFEEGDPYGPVCAALETLFAAPEGSVLEWRRTSTGLEPVRAPLDPAAKDTAEAFQRGALEFARMVRPIVAAGGMVASVDFAKELIDRVLRTPTHEEAKVIGLYPHSKDYAHSQMRPVANYEAVSTLGLYKALRASWWPPGLMALAGLDPRLLDSKHRSAWLTVSSLVRSPTLMGPFLAAKALDRLILPIARRFRHRIQHARHEPVVSASACESSPRL